jgi:hypothetical protein
MEEMMIEESRDALIDLIDRAERIRQSYFDCMSTRAICAYHTELVYAHAMFQGTLVIPESKKGFGIDPAHTNSDEAFEEVISSVRDAAKFIALNKDDSNIRAYLRAICTRVDWSMVASSDDLPKPWEKEYRLHNYESALYVYTEDK